MTTRERDEVFLELTRSVCPVCKETVDAEVNARNEQVFLRKRCREHGEFKAGVYGDADMYVAAQRFSKPGTRPLQTQTAARHGCPSDCGLCPEHKQHACLGIIEVNTGCNLDCPICFADSGSPRENGPDGYAITLDQCATIWTPSSPPRANRRSSCSPAGSRPSTPTSSRWSISPSSGR